jgi:D-3-phosphoglycerate dehydrogenase
MTPTIVLPDGDPHMAALLSRPDFAARLDRLGGARLHADLPTNDDELIARIGDAAVVILGAYLTAPVLRRLPSVRLVSFTGTGAATFVDLSAAAECGIAVANVAHYGDAAVAEHALALTLALAKKVVGNDRAVRAGEWHVGQGIELAGKTAGIVGYGGIGARFAGLLEAIGMRVVAWTPHPDPARLTSPAQRFAELPDLLADADVVSLHLLLTDDTRGLIDEPLLRSMKPGSLLVNTARAELIAPGALERVLAEGRIAAALAAARPAERGALPAPGLQHPGEPGAHARRGRRQHRALPVGHPGQHNFRRPAIICHWQLRAILLIEDRPVMCPRPNGLRLPPGQSRPSPTATSPIAAPHAQRAAIGQRVPFPGKRIFTPRHARQELEQLMEDLFKDPFTSRRAWNRGSGLAEQTVRHVCCSRSSRPEVSPSPISFAPGSPSAPAWTYSRDGPPEPPPPARSTRCSPSRQRQSKLQRKPAGNTKPTSPQIW